MTEGARLLVGALREALDLLEPVEVDGTSVGLQPAEPGSLLEQCVHLCEQQAPQLEPIRLLHHFACTGGTVFSKCISAMPNVQLLSEVDPLAASQSSREAPRFAPTDMFTLLRQSTRGISDALVIKLFAGQIRLLHGHASLAGQRLVLRDHAHSHFCWGDRIPDRPTLRRMLLDELEIPVLSVVTVRHPLDSFASLVRSGWVQFTPGTMDEYCCRYLEFLRQHADVPRFRYEDFTADPGATMALICEHLQVPFQPDFGELFDVFRLTGDSGRSATRVGVRTRLRDTDVIAMQASASPRYCELLEALGYGS